MHPHLLSLLKWAGGAAVTAIVSAFIWWGQIAVERDHNAQTAAKVQKIEEASVLKAAEDVEKAADEAAWHQSINDNIETIKTKQGEDHQMLKDLWQQGRK